jgi:hypothetical protein
LRVLKEINEELMIGLMSDTKVASRVDSYLTNMKMPWEKKEKKEDKVIMSVGRL